MAPADGAGGDNFAWSSGVSGDTAVLTAYLDDDNDLDSGSAYIFERNQGGPDDWGQVKKILPPDGTAGDQFGYAAAVDGDNVVVGAYLNADLGFWAGAAYIFERGQGGANNWGLVKKLYAADGAPYDNFGRAVAIQGDTIAIGAIRDNDNGNNSGSVYLFGRNQGGPGNWQQTGKIISSQGSADDQFGHSVDLDGNTLLVEELFNDAAGRSKQGAAYLFEREWITSTVWTEVRMFTAPDGPAQDIFGVSVAISGDTIAIGAVRDDDMGANSGSAYLYERDQGGPGNWGLVTKLVAFDGVPAANFGKVDLQGDTLVVGASGGDTAAPTSGFSPTPTSTTAGQLFFPIFSLPDVR